MAHKGAPGLKRYQSRQQDEGFLFTLIVNEGRDYTYEETAQFTVFDGLELIPPY